MKPDTTDIDLRKIANLVYQDPQAIIRRSVWLIFVCKALVFVWPFRLSDINNFGLLIGLAIIFAGTILFNNLVKLLAKVADITRVDAPRIFDIAYTPTCLAFFIRVLESGSDSGRVPVLSILVDLSLILTAVAIFGIHTMNEACQKYPREYEPFGATPSANSDLQPSNDDQDQNQD